MTAGAGDRDTGVGGMGTMGARGAMGGVEENTDTPVASRGGRPPQEGSSDLWIEDVPDTASAQAPGRAGPDKRAAAGDVGADVAGEVDGGTELVPAASRTEFQSRWNEVQTMFVDEPRAAVDRADALVAEVAQAVTAGFADRKAALEQRWSSGSDVATEDLRQVLRSYRAFFERLLQI